MIVAATAVAITMTVRASLRVCGNPIATMTTKLEAPLRREVQVGADLYTLTITPDGLSLVAKGKRKGYTLAWDAFVNGDAALAVALNASLANAPTRPATQVRGSAANAGSAARKKPSLKR